MPGMKELEALRKRSEATPASYYAVFDVAPDKTSSEVVGTASSYFESLTGGAQKISMVSYNIMGLGDSVGGVTTKFIPGQTTFEPVVLHRPFDSFCEEIATRFRKAVDGQLKAIKKDFSIAMLDYVDGTFTPVVWWDLTNALPITIGGFGFNAARTTEFTKFEISLQAEDIKISFP